jgi:NAD(P)-dependent dehydrogenase (short-subunit alcohol dehydrogenase family)
MKDTLRKKSAKDDEPSDITSPSTDSVATNPWADAQSEIISRQTSKTSHSPGPSVKTNTSLSPGPGLPIDRTLSDSPYVPRDPSQAPSEKPKRKKTAKRVSTTNGTVSDPQAIQAKDQTIAEEQKSEASTQLNTPTKRPARPSAIATKLDFCNPTPTISIEPVKAKTKAKNPFVPIHTRQASSQSFPTTPTITTTRFIPPSFTSSDHEDFFTSKIFVITNGASLIGASIVKLIHSLGGRVILGDVDPDRSKRLIRSIGEPHLVHFNKCDTRRYEDMLDLFKLAHTMYGRVDHAIFGVGDDGASTGNVADGERGWFGRAAKPGIEGVEREPPGLMDTMGAPVRFAHIALQYLRDRPRGKRNSIIAQDRSLTFLSSVACFKESPGLPIYQMAQHGVLGLIRNLQASINPERDGMRVNAVMTGVMVPIATSGAGGRMSVKLPSDMPEDIGRAVVGVIAAGNGEKTIVTRAGGRLHGRALYVVGGEGYDIEEGLNNSEGLWLGPKAAEHLAQAQEGIGKGSHWIMDLG